jgi:glycerate kinase
MEIKKMKFVIAPDSFKNSFFSITNGSKTLKQALSGTATDLEQTANNIARLIKKIYDNKGSTRNEK